MEPNNFEGDDLRISSEERVVFVRQQTSAIRNNDYIHWVALGIIATVCLACLLGLFVFQQNSWQSDTVSKLIFTIVGGVMGFIYGNRNRPNDK